MNSQPTFSSQKLSDFIKALGWVQVPEALRDGLYIFNHAQYSPQQLVFADESYADADETLLRVAARLAQIYDLTPLDAIRQIEESGDDVVVARVPDPRNRRIVTVPLLYAAQVMEAQKNLLLAGAVANKERRAFYSNKASGNAKTLMEAARFRHTEQSSFVFKTSCNIYAIEGEGNARIFSDEEVAPPPTFVRRAMLNIGTGLQELVNSIETRQTDQLVESVKAQKESSVSANLCAAIGELRDEEHPHPVDVSVSWSPLLPPPPEAPRQIIRIKTDYFPLIQDIGQELRPLKKPKRDSYVATVDKLEGIFNNLGQREGRVLLTLLTGTKGTIDGPTRVRVVLDAAKYDAALEIHKTTKVVARVSGILKPGKRQPFAFDLGSFDIMSVQI